MQHNNIKFNTYLYKTQIHYLWTLFRKYTCKIQCCFGIFDGHQYMGCWQHTRPYRGHIYHLSNQLNRHNLSLCHTWKHLAHSCMHFHKSSHTKTRHTLKKGKGNTTSMLKVRILYFERDIFFISVQFVLLSLKVYKISKRWKSFTVGITFTRSSIIV